jgi:trans-2,3-dihydro-3-hydroxyanthranilate isomerase
MQVDAFTTQPLVGNPCAILFNTDDLENDLKLAIAREMNLSETAFVRKSTVADFAVSYYTPAEEIPLAGHPTIATTFALVETGRLKLVGDHTTTTLELKVGPIRVDIFSQQGNIDRIVMTQNKPEFLVSYLPEEVMPIFGLSPSDLLQGALIQTVSTGTPQLMVPIRNLNTLRQVKVNGAAYAKLREHSDFFSPHLFCLSGVTSSGDTFARHFGIPPDTPEDPFTGSATGGMAAYLWHYGLIDRPNFIAEQGHWLNRPGKAWVEVLGRRNEIQGVKVGGSAVTVLRGEFTI